MARLLLCVLAVLAVAPAARAQLPVPVRDPVVVAAGDIACDPAWEYFNDGRGDERNCRQSQTARTVMDADPDAVLVLGDAQYEDSLLWKFQRAYDPTWGRFKAITRPVIGNHEYFADGAAGYFDYFNGPGSFGGPAGDRDKAYYSFDIGAWHVIGLNSVCSQIGGCGYGSAQEQWLRADLATHPAQCTLVMWHHPLFSSAGLGWPSMEPTWQILYDAGVEMVLSGHAHSYERLAPMDASGAVDPAFGVRQFVVGTGGKNLGGRARELPQSEAFNGGTFGALRLALRPDRYEWEFLRESGERFEESGTGLCHGAPSGRPPAAVTGTVSRVTRTTARVSAAVDPHNQPTTWRIEYGLTPAYGTTTLETPLRAATGGRQPVSAQLTGLRPDRTYHYRVVATNVLGSTVGEDRTLQSSVRSPYADLIASTTGLLAYWRFGEESGNVGFDATGGTLGAYTGGYGLGFRGAIDGDPDASAEFDGAGASMRAYGPVVSRNATIEGWWRWEDGGVLIRDDSSTGGWFIGRESNGRLGYRVAGRSYRTTRRIGAIRDGAWHHIALTKTAGLVQLFVDGTRVHLAYDATDAPATMPWYVMRNGPFDEHASGRVDDVAVYDRALRSTEVVSHYRAGAARTAPETRLRAPSGPTRFAAPVVRFGAERGSRFRCAMTGAGFSGDVVPCAAVRRLPRLADGTYGLSGYAIDSAGYPDPTPARTTFRVDTKVPSLLLTVPELSIYRLLKSGLTATVGCDESCTVRARLTISQTTARRLKLRRTELARVTVPPTRASGRIRLRPAIFGRSRKRLRRARSLTATVRVSVFDRAGNVRSQSQRLVISR
jgi:hypothetical protein